MTSRLGNHRRGLTLTELLVVVTIIVILAAILTPVLQPLLQGREVREAARGLNAYIQNAKARAKELGRPVGIVIRRASNSDLTKPDAPEFAYQVSLAEEPQVLTASVENLRAQVEGVVVTIPDFYLATLFAKGEAGRNDFIRFNYRGGKYRILNAAVSAGTLKLEIESNQSQKAPVNGSYAYEIFRKPRPTSATPIEMPTGSGLIMQLSGVGQGTTVNSNPLGEELFPSPIVGMLEFRTPTIDSLPTVPPQFRTDAESNFPKDPAALPLVIMFSPNGQVDQIHRLLPSPALVAENRSWLQAFPAKRPQGMIYLFLGRDGGTSVAAQLADTSNLWLTIDPRTGAINTAPNAGPGEETDPLRQVISARQFAASGQSVGGQ